MIYPEGHYENNETLPTVFSQQIINLSLEVYATPCKYIDRVLARTWRNRWAVEAENLAAVEADADDKEPGKYVGLGVSVHYPVNR